MINMLYQFYQQSHKFLKVDVRRAGSKQLQQLLI